MTILTLSRAEKIKAKKAKYRAKYRAENPEKIKANNAKYSAENPEKIKAKSAKYRAENPEKIKANSAKYKAENPEKIKAKNAKYSAKNPEKMKVISFIRAISEKTKTPRFEIRQLVPQELIDIKLLQLKLAGLIKELKNDQKTI